MKKTFSIVIITLFVLARVIAQTIPDSVATDSLVIPADSMLISLDSLTFSGDSLVLGDSLGLDSLSQQRDSLQKALLRRQSRLAQVQLSPDSLDEKVDYSAKDSMVYDIKNEKVYLYGEAKVAYQDLTIDAAYIEFDWASNIVTAEGRPDSSGTLAGNPSFKDKNQSFDAKRMRYNFKTSKGIIYNVSTKQGNDLYVLGAKAKFIGADRTDTLANDVVYSEDAIFTTCNHPHPHFGIRSKKQKVIPNKMVIVGPSNLEIGGVPTPLWLPFGFYPITQDGNTGLIFPKDYESHPTFGYGLKGVGWYFPLREKIDLEITGDIYTRGTWILRARSRYKTRYKYNGNFLLEFTNNKIENSQAIVSNQNAIKLNWTHTQDSKAHPYNSLNASVNIQTNGFQRNFQLDPNSQQQNSLSSNVSYSRRFAGKPFNFTASFRHSQNTTTGEVTFNLPNLRFTTGSLYPFKRKISKGGKEQWYEKINVDYTADAQNRFVTSDSTMFTQQTLASAQTGMRQEINANANFKILKYFNLSPRASYSENWYLQTITKSFDPTYTIENDTIDLGEGANRIEFDTVGYGTILTDTVSGFDAFHNFKNASIGLNTKIFGQMNIGKGPIRGLRHTMTPEVRFGYQPDYSSTLDSVDTDIRDSENELQYYTRFQNGFFDKPPTSGGRSMKLTFSLNNIVEMKTFTKRDSSTKNIQLLQSFNLRSSYDYAADSLNLEDLSISANTKILKGLTTLRGGAVYSFYGLNDEGTKKINKFQYDINKQPLRFVSANLTASTRLSLRQLREIFSKGTATPAKKASSSNKTGNKSKGGPKAASFSDISEAMKLTHDLRLNWSVVDGRDTLMITAHTLKLTVGNIQITENWGIEIQQFGYDFKGKGFIYPSFGFRRNLHCWQMSLNWRPTNGSFQFTLKVNPGTLEFINIPYQKGSLQTSTFR